jgi:SAM-dependent methyltransferase
MRGKMREKMKEKYLTDPLEKIRGDYQRKNPMEQYYQMRKLEFISDEINRFVVDKKRIADLGAGCGIFLDISKKNRRDIFSVGIDLAGGNCREIKNKNHFSICADVENLPLKNSCLDGIYFLDVIEHLKEPSVLKEIYRILKSDGELLISTPNKYGIYEYKEIVFFGWHIKDIKNMILGRPRSYFPYHIRLYSKKELIKTLESYDFSIERIISIGFCLPFFGNLNFFFKVYKYKRFLNILEFFERNCGFFNFLIIVRCKKRY